MGRRRMAVRSGRSGWLWLVIVMLIGSLLLARVFRRQRPASHPPVADLSITSPLNAAGGGAVAGEAYQVYSDLYREPAHEALVFSEQSRTDIPQVNGSCLQPAAADEREMADAFVAANRQSHAWQPLFVIAQGYRIVAAEAARIQSCVEEHFRIALGAARIDRLPM